jgi:hypothetical protein
MLAWAHAMDGARHQFLSRAGFAQDQDGGIGGSNYLSLAQNSLESRAAAYHFFEILLRLGFFVLHTLNPIAFPEFLHKRDPPEGT